MSLVADPIHINKQPGFNAFEELYIDVREKEGRVLTDYEVELLPDVDPLYAYYKEWQVRKRSMQKLLVHLRQKDRPLKILEIGCGNGWLAAKLASIANTKVTGMDINRIELEQAKRVFKKPNLEFVYSHFDPEVFRDEKFDVIVFAASVQYFQSLKGVLYDALECLTHKGEIHIIDSHFYKANEVEDAATRTLNYYKALGYPGMAANYFHHALPDLQPFNYEVLFNPTGIFNRRSKKAPFYWFCITH